MPGSTSTKKLPPRKIRGRTFSSASSLIGSASSDSSIVTRPPPPSSASTSVTLPTSIPAIRTGERVPRLLVSSKSARSTYGSANGFHLNHAPSENADEQEERQQPRLEAAHGTSARFSMPSSRDL